MKNTQFKGSLKRQFNEGKIGMSVHTGISYKRPKKQPKTKWERFKNWLGDMFKKKCLFSYTISFRNPFSFQFKL